jgi:hypothetical protein
VSLPGEHDLGRAEREAAPVGQLDLLDASSIDLDAVVEPRSTIV